MSLLIIGLILGLRLFGVSELTVLGGQELGNLWFDFFHQLASVLLRDAWLLRSVLISLFVVVEWSLHGIVIEQVIYVQSPLDIRNLNIEVLILIANADVFREQLVKRIIQSKVLEAPDQVIAGSTTELADVGPEDLEVATQPLKVRLVAAARRVEGDDTSVLILEGGHRHGWLRLDEAEHRLLLLEGEVEHASTGLEAVLEVLIQVHGGLHLDEGAELRVVILDVYAAQLVLVQDGVKPAYRYVDYPHVGLVTPPEPYPVCVLEVDYVHLSVLFAFRFVHVYLLRFDYHEVLLGLLDVEDLEV